MALLRLLCFPSSQQLPSPIPLQISLPAATTNAITTTTTTLRSPPSLSFSSSNLLSIRTRRTGLFLLHVSSTTEALSSTVEASQLNDSTTVQQVEDEEEEEEEEEEDESTRTRLVAQNVPFTSTADHLRPLFEKYGTVLSVQFWMYNKTRSRGVAFITMSSHEEAVAALTNLDSFEIDGRVIKLDWANRRKKYAPKQNEEKAAPTHNLYVTNLPYQARAKDLRGFFNAAKGNVVSGKIVFDEKRKSKGFGFVSFSTLEEAEEALSAFQGKVLMGKKIRVEHGRKVKKEEAATEDANSSVDSSNSIPEADKADEEV